MNMIEQVTGVTTALISKFGFVKVLGFGSALAGAAMMACFRPPKTRKEMFTQAVVALGSSLLFGGVAVQFIMHQYPFLLQGGIVEVIASVHGLIGALSWGIFGGVSVLMEKFSHNPLNVIKRIKDVVTK